MLRNHRKKCRKTGPPNLGRRQSEMPSVLEKFGGAVSRHFWNHFKGLLSAQGSFFIEFLIPPLKHIKEHKQNVKWLLRNLQFLSSERYKKKACLSFFCRSRCRKMRYLSGRSVSIKPRTSRLKLRTQHGRSILTQAKMLSSVNVSSPSLVFSGNYASQF